MSAEYSVSWDLAKKTLSPLNKENLTEGIAALVMGKAEKRPAGAAHVPRAEAPWQGPGSRAFSWELDHGERGSSGQLGAWQEGCPVGVGGTKEMQPFPEMPLQAQ